MPFSRKSSPPVSEPPPDPRLVQRGWLDSPVILAEHASPLIAAGPSDRNWLLDLFSQFPIERLGHWVSLGCGSGGQEIWAIEKGLFTTVDGFDSSADAVAVGRANAEKANVGRARFHVADPETLELEPGRYAGALTAMTLFRIADLDRLLAQVAASLAPGGWFLVNEYVGPAQFQHTDHQLQIIDELLALLPDRLRFDYVQSFVKQVYHRRPRAFWDEVAPREAISSEKIAPLLERHFELVDRRDYGGTILNPLLENIVGNFAGGGEEDLTILRLLAYVERLLLREGCLPSDFAVFVARKRS